MAPFVSFIRSQTILFDFSKPRLQGFTLRWEFYSPECRLPIYFNKRNWFTVNLSETTAFCVRFFFIGFHYLSFITFYVCVVFTFFRLVSFISMRTLNMNIYPFCTFVHSVSKGNWQRKTSFCTNSTVLLVKMNVRPETTKKKR